MNKILLLSDGNPTDSTISDLTKLSNFSIYRAKDTKQAIRLLKKHSPDFVLCTGKILQNEDGRYILELN